MSIGSERDIMADHHRALGTTGVERDIPLEHCLCAYEVQRRRQLSVPVFLAAATRR
jgi:hypothetical protein